MDECKLDIAGCSSSADCINAVGSFSCKCRSGFIGDGFTCKKGINFPALQSVLFRLTQYGLTIGNAMLCMAELLTGKCHSKDRTCLKFLCRFGTRIIPPNKTNRRTSNSRETEKAFNSIPEKIGEEKTELTTEIFVIARL